MTASDDDGLIGTLPDPVEPDLDPVAVDAFVHRYLVPSEVRSFPFLAAGANGRVLDLGAGSGRSLAHFDRTAEDVTVHCLDPTGYQLQWARSRAADCDVDAQFERGRGETLPYDDDAFDAVVCKEVLCAVDDPERTLAECRRVLRPDGQLRYLEHVRSDGLSGVVEDRVAPHWRRFSGCDVDRPTDETLADSDFEVLEQHRFRNVGLCPPWTYVAGVARPE